MARCNDKLCVHCWHGCIGGLAPYACPNRLTPVKAKKKMEELGIKTIQELIEYMREEENKSNGQRETN